MTLSRTTAMQGQLVWPRRGRAGLAPHGARRPRAAARRVKTAWLTFIAAEGLLLLATISVVGGIRPVPALDASPQPRPAPTYERRFDTDAGPPPHADRGPSLRLPGPLLPPPRPGS